MSTTGSEENLNLNICINCTNPVNVTVKIPSNKSIKCEQCSDIVDKYIEFESCMVFLDCVLLSEKVFRHIIFNSKFKVYNKITIALLLIESFTLWKQKFSVTEAFSGSEREDFFHEKEFYICVLEVLLNNLLIYALLILVFVATNTFEASKEFLFKIYKIIAIANFSKFLSLFTLVWKDNIQDLTDVEVIHRTLMIGHYLISFVTLYSVITKASKIRSFLIISFVFVVKEGISKLLDLSH